MSFSEFLSETCSFKDSLNVSGPRIIHNVLVTSSQEPCAQASLSFYYESFIQNIILKSRISQLKITCKTQIFTVPKMTRVVISCQFGQICFLFWIRGLIKSRVFQQFQHSPHLIINSCLIKGRFCAAPSAVFIQLAAQFRV